MIKTQVNILNSLTYLKTEKRIVSVTNGIFIISGVLLEENNLYYIFVTEEIGKFFANVAFSIDQIESINVNEKHPEIVEIILKG